VTTDGTPTIELPDGAIAVDTTNDKIYFRSGGEWQEVIGGGGGGIAIQTEAPIDTELLWLDTDEPGISGPTGPTGSTGPAGVTTGPTAPVDTSVIWADTSTTGVAIIPVGGTTGQMLSKTSGTDYDTAWATPVTSSDLALKANLAGPTFTGTVSGISKTMVGLGSVDNTADTAKPVSTAQQTALDLKANLASPSLTGTPSAPTAAVSTNTTQIATTAFVRAEVSALVGGATATLDTLGEIATALGNDANLSSTLTTSIGLKAPIASPTFTGTPAAPTATVGTNTTQLATTAFVAVQASPIGMITPYAGSTAPTNWQLCYGQAISRTTYASLFAIIGTAYGVGDGTTTFNLPDLRGRTVAGLDNMGGSDAGRLSTANTLGTTTGTETVTLTSAQSGVPAHAHANTVTNNAVTTGAGSAHQHANTASFNGSAASHTHTQNAHEHNLYYQGSVGGNRYMVGDYLGGAGSSYFIPSMTTITASAVSGYSIAQGVAATNQNTSITPSGSVTMSNASESAHTHSVTSNVTISNVNNTAADAASAHSNMQPTMTINYIILVGA
jgi:microcystin-dependent protein